jgi:hypothetical protein
LAVSGGENPDQLLEGWNHATLAITPFPIPGAVEMVFRALGGDELPIFDSIEDRVALCFGVLLISA